MTGSIVKKSKNNTG